MGDGRGINFQNYEGKIGRRRKGIKAKRCRHCNKPNEYKHRRKKVDMNGYARLQTLKALTASILVRTNALFRTTIYHYTTTLQPFNEAKLPTCIVNAIIGIKNQTLCMSCRQNCFVKPNYPSTKYLSIAFQGQRTCQSANLQTLYCRKNDLKNNGTLSSIY